MGSMTMSESVESSWLLLLNYSRILSLYVVTSTHYGMEWPEPWQLVGDSECYYCRGLESDY
jgi:hypothetical protein